MLMIFRIARQKINYLVSKLKSKDNTATFAKGAASSFIIKIVGTGLAFLVQTLAARFLGVEGYGVYGIAFSWMSILALIGQMGFDTASSKYIAAYYSEKKWGLLRGFISYSNRVITIACLISGLFLASGAWLFQKRIDIELVYTLSLGSILLPIVTFLNTKQKRLLACKKVFLAQFPLLIFRNVSTLVTLLFLSLLVTKLSPSQFMGITVISSTLTLLLSSWFEHRVISRKIRRVKKRFASREWIETGRTMIFLASLGVILNQSDTVMLGAISGEIQTGLYIAARKISALTVFPLMAVNSILSPMVVSLYRKSSPEYLATIADPRERKKCKYENKNRLQNIVTIAVNSTFILTLVIVLTIAFGGKFFLNLFGKEFTGGYIVLLIHLGGQLINAMSGPVALLLNMTGHHNIAAKVLGIGAILNIILNWLLIPVFGAVGASIATAVATIFWNVVMVIVVRRKLKIISIVMPKFLIQKIIGS